MGRLKKYEFTGETREIDDYNRTVLKRIRAVRDFGKVKAGEIGGWIESEKNLSQEGKAWVAEEAWVSGNAVVEENARVAGRTWISEEALVKGEAVVTERARISGEVRICGRVLINGEVEISQKACIFGEARVRGKARISGKARVFGKARVRGKAQICGETYVSGEARVSGKTWISGEACVSGETCVSGEAHISERVGIKGKAEIADNNSHLYISPIGSRDDSVFFYRDKEKGIMVNCGCFEGSLEKFQEKVKETHGDNKHAAYRMAVELAKLRIPVKGTAEPQEPDGEEDAECLQTKL